MAISEVQLLPLLQGTLSNNPDERFQAEKVLAEYGQLEGYCSGLLKIAAAEQVDVSVRQASAICLKNTVKKRWSLSVHTPEANRKPGEFPIQPSDKANLMGNLQECVIRSMPLVRTQLLECVKEIVSMDYPQPWSSLLPEAVVNVQSSDVRRVFSALLVLRTIARRLEFMHEMRSVLEEFAATALPVLLPLFQGLLAESSIVDELAMMMKTVLKIFWSCVYIDIPQALVQDQAQCRAWLEAILTLLKRPVPTESQPQDPMDRLKWPWWKLKKWALHIPIRVFERYGDPRITVSEPSQAFSLIIKPQYTTAYLVAVMQMLEDVAKGSWYSPRVLILLSQYVEVSIKPKETYKLLEPYLNDILAHSILPQCFFTAADQEEWELDPMEVIRKNGSGGMYMSIDELFDPCNAAVGLIVKVMDSKKCQARCLDPFMECVVGIAKQFRAAHDANPAAVPVEIAWKMNGVTLVIGSLLEDVLTSKRNAKYRDNLEAMAQQYLLPLFSSPYGPLRAKGCWLAGKFATTCNFTQPDGSKAKGQGPLFDELFARVLHCMQDRDLPVQVEAVIALRDFVEALSDAKRLAEKLHPILSDLLRHLFHLAGLVEATDIVTTLETIAQNIGEDIQPFAVEMCQQLVAVYHKLLHEKDADDDAADIFEASMTISSAIITILEACSGLPDTIRKMEELLLPMMEQMCNKSAEEVFDQVCEMLTYFTYFVDPISERTWAFWPKLHEVLKDWGIDYVENIIVPLDNMICKGTDTFCGSQQPNYRESVYDMVKYCLTGDFTEMEVAPATKLLEIVLLNCKGRVDEWVWPFLELAMSKVDSVKDAAFATLCMNVVPAALMYNAPLTLQLLEQHGKTTAVFGAWFKMLQDDKKYFRRIHDKKLTCLGLTMLFPLTGSVLPAAVQQSLPQVLSTILKLLKLLKEQEEARAEEESSSEDGSANADDGDDDYEDVEEGDLGEDEDAAYLKEMEKTAERMRRAAGDKSLVDWDDDWTDDEEIETAIDDIDAFDWLATTLRELQSVSPPQFQELVGALDDGGKAALQEIIQLAHIRKSKKQDAIRADPA